MAFLYTCGRVPKQLICKLSKDPAAILWQSAMASWLNKMRSADLAFSSDVVSALFHAGQTSDSTTTTASRSGWSKGHGARILKTTWICE
jgi:hypothetical protein